ncbi:hypothetical protein [Floccifex porci]|uniref:DUF3592 domain-containing protein n=1 Tax=Floccifex porci TaxID=2606629 RepID=A0A7X2N3G1_9FIRM|nr:hypothetical protein [Floccifex porci]MSS01784.1 hypothetical protein [Floccifex porci]
MKAFIVLFLSVLSFFISLIFLTKKEEKIEKNITSDYCTKGKLKTCLVKKHAIKEEDTFTVYNAKYQYKVNKKIYLITIQYEISQSDEKTQIPEIVDIYYNKDHPKWAIVKSSLEPLETSHALLPSILFAIFIFLILTHFIIAPII